MAKKLERVTFRCRTTDKETVELAAKISGCSLSDFVLKAALEKAALQFVSSVSDNERSRKAFS